MRTIGMASDLPAFFSSQVKMLSVITHLLKAHPNGLRNVATRITEGVVSLLKLCDATMTDARLQLLVATRQMLATDLRASFASHINTFLDDAFLLGVRGAPSEIVPGRKPALSNVKAYSAPLRPVERLLQPRAYNLLADVIHHSRHKLRMPHIQRAVFLFSRTLMDATQTMPLQTISAHLLINLTNVIFTHTEADGKKRRTLMMTVARAFIERVQLLTFDAAHHAKSDAGAEKDQEALKALGTYYEVSKVLMDEGAAAKTASTAAARAKGLISRVRLHQTGHRGTGPAFIAALHSAPVQGKDDDARESARKLYCGDVFRTSGSPWERRRPRRTQGTHGVYI